MSPLDKETFLVFAKTVCCFNASRWKRPGYLESRILKEKPDFNREYLDEFVVIFEYMVDFYNIKCLPKKWEAMDGCRCEDGYYIERGIRNGKFYEKEVVIPKIVKAAKV